MYEISVDLICIFAFTENCVSPWPSVNIAPFSILSMGTFFVKNQSCLNKYKNIFIAQSSKGFQPLFTGYHRDRIVALHKQWRSYYLKRSDFMRYANLMRFWTEIRSSAYISYFLQILLQLSLSLSFHLTFIYYFNFKQRIKCGKKGSICYTSVQFIFRLTVFYSLVHNPRKKSCYFTLILFWTS